MGAVRISRKPPVTAGAGRGSSVYDQLRGLIGGGGVATQSIGRSPLPSLRGAPGGNNQAAMNAAHIRKGFNPQQEAAFRQWTAAVAHPQAGGQSHPGGPTAPGPSWEEMVNWDSQRRDIDLGYERDLAQNQHQMDALRASFAPADYGFQRSWDQAGGQIVPAMLRKGMGRSGVAQRGWQDYGQGRDMALRQLLGGRQGQLDQLLGAKGDIERRRASGLSGIRSAEQWRRAQLAQMIGGK